MLYRKCEELLTEMFFVFICQAVVKKSIKIWLKTRVSLRWQKFSHNTKKKTPKIFSPDSAQLSVFCVV